MRIWVQKSASMQKRTSPPKFGDLAEKSGLNSVSDLSTKVPRAPLHSSCTASRRWGELLTRVGAARIVDGLVDLREADGLRALPRRVDRALVHEVLELRAAEA